LFIILNLISLVLTSFGIIDQIWENYLGFGSFNNYLNTFNWLGFFSLGVLLKRNMKYWLDKLNKNIFFILITYLSLLILSILLEPSSGGYFSKLAIPLELAGMFMFFSFATLNIFHKPIVYKISKFTFTIYLLHFLVFPFRKFLINDYFFQFLNPIFYLLICSGVIYVGKNFSKKN
jgi:peptidoglycan/LPS O-acetylase OafA/YrhL